MHCLSDFALWKPNFHASSGVIVYIIALGKRRKKGLLIAFKFTVHVSNEMLLNQKLEFLDEHLG